MGKVPPGGNTGTVSPPFTVTTGETLIPHVFRVVLFHHRLPSEVEKIFSTNMCQIENVLRIEDLCKRFNFQID